MIRPDLRGRIWVSEFSFNYPKPVMGDQPAGVVCAHRSGEPDMSTFTTLPTPSAMVGVDHVLDLEVRDTAFADHVDR